ncbi:hypothetical protein WA026_012788 [Henosepilachna vigintioctopunctata]|uniref:PPM-type phosphatase domain-containing protein n=1 Tax=Henosepilachna vigintioctopunctata TaxID=420089 RepID=A0AAW1U1T8_9CUCU
MFEYHLTKTEMSIGVNLRVTGYCRQGGRKYMEDFFSVAYQQTEDERDLEYAFIGIYDGHGGAEAAAFAKEHLMESIIKHKSFWSDNDEEVLRAIKDGYIATHYAMWKEQEKWPKTASGLPSTAGTTASVAFIRRGKIYVGHVGDSGIVLGYQPPNCSDWKAKPLTMDHKPENTEEMNRIKQCGGKVVLKSGVPRVVWNRPRIGHQGPVRRSTPIDEIPFLAVARSLGDLWSYNSRINQFIVSPNPDCSVITVDTSIHRCLIFGTDGLFNMLSPYVAISIVHQTEKHNEFAALNEVQKAWLNPSKLLVERALERWYSTNMRADNTSVVTLMLDPPGPPRAQVLKDQKKNYPATGLKILTRFEDLEQTADECSNKDNLETNEHTIIKDDIAPAVAQRHIETIDKLDKDLRDTNDENVEVSSNYSANVESSITSPEVSSNSHPLKERNFVHNLKESTSFEPKESYNPERVHIEKKYEINCEQIMDNSIQINEISSSSSDLFEHIDEEWENDSNTPNKHNLRSSGKDLFVSQNKTEFKGHIFKRKNPENGGEPLRKSVRLDKTKGKSPLIASKENNLKEMTSKLTLTEKILKNKKVKLKPTVLNKSVVKKKFKLMLDSVKQRVDTNSLYRVPAKISVQKKNICVSNFSQSDFASDTSKKTIKNDHRSRSQHLREMVKKNVDLTKPSDSKRSRSIHFCSEMRAGHRAVSDQSCRLRSSSREGNFTFTSNVVSNTILISKKEVMARKSKSLDQLENLEYLDSPRKSSCLKLQQSSKDNIFPKRKSLRNNMQNKSSKLHLRLSRSVPT